MLGIRSPADPYIERDLGRTMPKNAFFKEEGVGAEVHVPGQQLLFNVVHAYAVHDSEVGYSQGMNFLAAVLLLHMKQEQAFWVLVQLMRRYRMRGLFAASDPQLAVEHFKLQRLTQLCAPALHQLFTEQGVDISVLTSEWLITLFSYRFPLSFTFRVWDALLVKGFSYVLQVAVSILRTFECHLLSLTFESIVFFLREIPTRLANDTRLAESVLVGAHKVTWDRDKLEAEAAAFVAACAARDAIQLGAQRVATQDQQATRQHSTVQGRANSTVGGNALEISKGSDTSAAACRSQAETLLNPIRVQESDIVFRRCEHSLAASQKQCAQQGEDGQPDESTDTRGTGNRIADLHAHDPASFHARAQEPVLDLEHPSAHVPDGEDLFASGTTTMNAVADESRGTMGLSQSSRQAHDREGMVGEGQGLDIKGTCVPAVPASVAAKVGGNRQRSEAPSPKEHAAEGHMMDGEDSEAQYSEPTSESSASLSDKLTRRSVVSAAFQGVGGAVGAVGGAIGGVVGSTGLIVRKAAAGAGNLALTPVRGVIAAGGEPMPPLDPGSKNVSCLADRKRSADGLLFLLLTRA